MMNQMIFKLGLSVETISVYLLCCSLSDMNTTITEKKLLEVWNDSRQSLTDALGDLEKKRILIRIISDGQTHSYFQSDRP